MADSNKIHVMAFRAAHSGEAPSRNSKALFRCPLSLFWCNIPPPQGEGLPDAVPLAAACGGGEQEGGGAEGV